MQGYNHEGFHQFATNIQGTYRFAVVSDVVLSGPDHHLARIDYYLSMEAARGTTDVLYLSASSMSHDDAVCWPAKPKQTTWCQHPPTPNNHHRGDLLAAPPGFILARRGMFLPIYLHYGFKIVPAAETGPAVHLIGGATNYPGARQSTNGDLDVTVGAFATGAVTVNLMFSEDGELLYETTLWQALPQGDKRVTEDV